MKIFLNEENRTASIVSIIVMSILFMKFIGWASFNPKDFGFWLAIVNATLVQLFINFLFYKFWIPNKKD